MTKDGKEPRDQRDQREFMKAIEDLRREIRNEMRGLKDSVKYASDTCDEVKTIGQDIRELRREVKELTQINQQLRAENKKLEIRIEELEQYQRANNLEIKGVPLEGDPYELVKKLGEVLNEPVMESDIDICHRVPTSESNKKNIVVRFVHRTKRNALLTKSKKKRVDTGSLGFSGVACPVYINEHLTRQNKQLLGAAIGRKRNAGWRYVWSSGGRVFARKDETTNAIRIASNDDLLKITT